MDLNAIFVDHNTKEGLYAIKYDGEEKDEFSRLLELWSDPQYIRTYLKANEDYLKTDFFKSYKFSDLVIKIFKESQELDDYFIEIEERFYSCDIKLQEVFRPLIDSEYTFPMHQQTKTSVENWKTKRAILRLYAIRIGENTYVITGGAIKLVKRMFDHPDTERELIDKIPKVRKYLQSIGLNNEDDLNYML